jgi:hypothetical protein
MPETYIVIDIETDGPIPADNNMLALGAAAFNAQGEMLGTFAVNFELCPGAVPDPKTMAWWAERPDAYAATRINPKAPGDALLDFEVWLEALPLGKKVAVYYPAMFDGVFVRWYFMHFLKRCPFGFGGMDMKTFACGELGTTYGETVKKKMPKEWFAANLPHTHLALDDAVEQGHLFAAMFKQNRARHKKLLQEIHEKYIADVKGQDETARPKQG